jgi:hypothetical protein
MRRILQILLLVCAITCLYACSKDKQTAPDITGTWELRETFGGVLGTQSFKPGNGHTYTFSGGSSFTQYAGKDTLANQGTYSIKIGATKIQGVLYNMLVINGTTSGSTEIQVQDTIMKLGLEVNNGVGAYYAKIK